MTALIVSILFPGTGTPVDEGIGCAVHDGGWVVQPVVLEIV